MFFTVVSFVVCIPLGYRKILSLGLIKLCFHPTLILLLFTLVIFADLTCECEFCSRFRHYKSLNSYHCVVLFISSRILGIAISLY